MFVRRVGCRSIYCNAACEKYVTTVDTICKLANMLRPIDVGVKILLGVMARFAVNSSEVVYPLGAVGIKVARDRFAYVAVNKTGVFTIYPPGRLLYVSQNNG